MTIFDQGRWMRSVAAACALAGGLAAGGAVAAPAKAVAEVDPYTAPNQGSRFPKWSELPNWSGVWEKNGHQGFDPRIPIGVPQPPPYNAQYKPRYDAIVAASRAAKPIADNGARCVGNGFPAMMTMTFPMEIEINRRQVTIIAEYLTEVRRIYTDGRGHPKEVALPQSTGHSIGYWKDGQLFVDTCCIKESTLLGGGPHSDAMHVKERWWLEDANTLKEEITVTDPKAYTKPWVSVKTFQRRPDWEPNEFICAENNRNPVGENGVTQVVLPTEK